MQSGAVLPRRPYRQAGEGQQVGGAVADLVDDESPRPAHAAGAGDRAVEIGAGEPHREEQRRERPPSQRDSRWLRLPTALRLR